MVFHIILVPWFITCVTFEVIMWFHPFNINYINIYHNLTLVAICNNVGWLLGWNLGHGIDEPIRLMFFLAKNHQKNL